MVETEQIKKIFIKYDPMRCGKEHLYVYDKPSEQINLFIENCNSSLTELELSVRLQTLCAAYIHGKVTHLRNFYPIASEILSLRTNQLIQQ